MLTLAIIGLLFRPLGLLILISTIIIMALTCWFVLWLIEPAKPDIIKPRKPKKSKKSKPRK